jgi:hypothetical protein
MTESVPFCPASWPWLPVRRNGSDPTGGMSFSPPTDGNPATALFGGRQAMAAMRQAILSAKSFVYVADWIMDVDLPLADWEAQDHQDVASANTALLESVFPHLPSDHWRDIDGWNTALRTGPGWFGFGPPPGTPGVAEKPAGLHGQVRLCPRLFLADKGLDSGGALSNIYT